MVELNMEELFKLYTEPPFLTYDKLCEYLKETCDIKICKDKLSDKMSEVYPDLSDIKKKNRRNFNENRKMPSFSQLEHLHKLHCSPSSMSYEELVKYAKENFGVEISRKKLIKIMQEAYPDLVKSDGLSISSGGKQEILELLEKGITQTEVAGMFNISQPQVSRILKKSHIEIEDIKRNRILVSLNGISLKEIESLWQSKYRIAYLKKELIGRGAKLSQADIRYLIINILKDKKKCKTCGKDMDLDNLEVYCSDECRKQSRLKARRDFQHSRILKGIKTMEYISRSEKVEEADGICYLCGERLVPEINDWCHPLYVVLNHVNSEKNNNYNSLENIKAVCRCCGTLKGNRPAEYFSMEHYKNNRALKLESYIPKGTVYKQIDEKQFEADCINGMTISELCSKYNISTFTVWKMKNKMGLLDKSMHRILDGKFVLRNVVKMSKKGATVNEISKALDISSATVSIYKRKAFDAGLLERKYTATAKRKTESQIYLEETAISSAQN